MRTTLVALFAAVVVMALSGFACASTEMSTAKVALQQKDYPKAEAALRKEVSARPQNGEAWLLLGELYRQQLKSKEMVDAYAKALASTDRALTAAERETVHANTYNAWQDYYNGALSKFNSGDYDGALAKLEAAASIRPDASEVSYMRGVVYREQKEQAKENKAYKEYIALVDADAQRGVNAGLMLGRTRSQIEAKLGKPAKSSVDAEGGYGYYKAGDLYAYYNASEKLVGWRYYEGSPVPDIIREVPFYLHSGPYYTLGVDAYYEGEKNPSRYDEALKYLQFVERFDVDQEKVGQVIADIYRRTNRTDEAKKAFEANIRQNPNDPSLYINYGSLLVNMKDYAGAIENFRKALPLAPESDEKHHLALFNLGAVYKNWGADLQTKAGDKPTRAQTDDINGKLRESVKYFEDYRRLNGASDFVVLVELANLYLVLNDAPKFNGLLGDLERQKETNASNPDYWQAMSRLYVIKGDTRKSEDALKKADELRNR